jgi:DNA-binding NtrC family response regulator
MQGLTKVHILILGLDEVLGAELKNALREGNQVVRADEAPAGADCCRVIARLKPDILFCPAAPSCFRNILEAVKQVRPGLPIVVVSRFPEVTEWLDAIEAGASDYCAPPFVPAHLRWILETNLTRACPAVA